MEVLYLLIPIVGLPSLYLLWYGAPYAPSHPDSAQETATYFKENNIDTVVDIGAGDGRVVIALAEAGIEAHGYELNPLLVAVGCVRIWYRGLSDRAQIHLKDIWRVDLSKYSGVYVYGIDHMMSDLKEKFSDELPPTAHVASHMYEIPGWNSQSHKSSVYFYTLQENANNFVRKNESQEDT